MAITYPLSLPSSPSFTSASFGIKRNIVISESPFTGQQKVFEYDRAVWYATLSLPPMKRDLAADWCAFFVALKGRRGTFLLGDPDATAPRGTVTGNISLANAEQAGDTRIRIGYTGINGTVVFEAGDYLQIGTTSSSRLYMVVEQAIITNGYVYITIEPSLRADASSGASVIYNSPKSVFRLDSNDITWDTDVVSKYGITFSCTEAL